MGRELNLCKIGGGGFLPVLRTTLLLGAKINSFFFFFLREFLEKSNPCGLESKIIGFYYMLVS